MNDFTIENDLLEYTSHSEHKQDLIRGIIADMRHTLNQKQISELNRVLINRLITIHDNGLDFKGNEEAYFNLFYAKGVI